MPAGPPWRWSTLGCAVGPVSRAPAPGFASPASHRRSWGMDLAAQCTGDPQVVLDRAGPFLTEDPVRNNLILTLLHSRVAHPEPGRYWMVADPDRVRGVVFQSPLSFVATLT